MPRSKCRCSIPRHTVGSNAHWLVVYYNNNKNPRYWIHQLNATHFLRCANITLRDGKSGKIFDTRHLRVFAYVEASICSIDIQPGNWNNIRIRITSVPNQLTVNLTFEVHESLFVPRGSRHATCAQFYSLRLRDRARPNIFMSVHRRACRETWWRNLNLLLLCHRIRIINECSCLKFLQRTTISNYVLAAQGRRWSMRVALKLPMRARTNCIDWTYLFLVNLFFSNIN